MGRTDESRKQMLDMAAWSEELVRQDADPPLGLPTVLAVTRQISAYPTTPRCFFACQPVTVMGAEVEGAAATVSDRPGSFFALNIGTALPPIGTEVLATLVGNRWVFRYDN